MQNPVRRALLLFAILTVAVFFQNCGNVNLLKSGAVSTSILPDESDDSTSDKRGEVPTEDPPPANGVPNGPANPPPPGTRNPPPQETLDAWNYGTPYPGTYFEACNNISIRQHFGNNPILGAFFGADNLTISIPIRADERRFQTASFQATNGTNIFLWISRHPADFESVRNVPTCYGGANESSARNLFWSNMREETLPANLRGHTCYIEPGTTYYLNIAFAWVDPTMEDQLDGIRYSVDPNSPLFNNLIKNGRNGIPANAFYFVGGFYCAYVPE